MRPIKTPIFHVGTYGFNSLLLHPFTAQHVYDLCTTGSHEFSLFQCVASGHTMTGANLISFLFVDNDDIDTEFNLSNS